MMGNRNISEVIFAFFVVLVVAVITIGLPFLLEGNIETSEQGYSEIYKTHLSKENSKRLEECLKDNKISFKEYKYILKDNKKNLIVEKQNSK